MTTRVREHWDFGLILQKERPHLLQYVFHLDIVRDVSWADDPKSRTRWKRGKSSTIPRNWKEPLREAVSDVQIDQVPINTRNTGVQSINQQDVSELAPCSHEKADTHIMRPIKDAIHPGLHKGYSCHDPYNKHRLVA